MDNVCTVNDFSVPQRSRCTASIQPHKDAVS
jgi:hypothetical protein